MTSRRFVFAFFLVLALNTAVFAGRTHKEENFEGTYTCMVCDLLGQEGLKSQCEDLGHQHGLRLDNGKYIHFLKNDHSFDLIAGGGRHDVRLSINGTYYPEARMVNVDHYTIDGITTAWCGNHSRMDKCNWEAKHKENKDKKSGGLSKN